MAGKKLNLSSHQHVSLPPGVRDVRDLLPKPGEVDSAFDRRAKLKQHLAEAGQGIASAIESAEQVWRAVIAAFSEPFGRRKAQGRGKVAYPPDEIFVAQRVRSTNSCAALLT
jgi:hypothetical protein